MLVYGLGPGLGSKVKAYKVLGDASGLAGRLVRSTFVLGALEILCSGCSTRSRGFFALGFWV